MMPLFQFHYMNRCAGACAPGRLIAACDNPQQCHHGQKNCCHRKKLEVLETDLRREVVVYRTTI